MSTKNFKLANIIVPWWLLGLLTLVLIVVHAVQYAGIASSQSYTELKTVSCTVDEVKYYSEGPAADVTCGGESVRLNENDTVGILSHPDNECSQLRGNTFGDVIWKCGKAREREEIVGGE